LAPFEILIKGLIVNGNCELVKNNVTVEFVGFGYPSSEISVPTGPAISPV
jgi:hypothetical protein